MKIETKYSLGDTVFNIHRERPKVWQPCSFCDSEGTIKGADGTDHRCPKCYGNKGQYTFLMVAWTVAENFTIRLVEYRYTEAKIEERYMASTGGGRVYRVENLFLTKEEAQAACDQRNITLEEKAND